MKLVSICIIAMVLVLCTFCARAESDLDYQDYATEPAPKVQFGPNQDVPYPFTRVLNVGDEGKDVYTLQRLLNRWNKKPNLPITQKFDTDTARALNAWKVSHQLANNTIFDVDTAFKFLNEFQYDGYKDAGIKPADMGLKFRVYIPVYRNRSIETTATLYDENNNILHKWIARTRAHTIFGEEPWPTWDSKGYGLNEFTGWGYTPSGLTLLDLNTPEPDSVVDLYGKWNVLRAVRGIEGNAEICMPYLRNGILAHTGNWAKHGWKTTDPMPNSSGCIHNHPEDQEIITEILKAKGVIANENPFGTLPYPYQPQGLLSIEVIDDDMDY